MTCMSSLHQPACLKRDACTVLHLTIRYGQCLGCPRGLYPITYESFIVLRYQAVCGRANCVADTDSNNAWSSRDRANQKPTAWVAVVAHTIGDLSNITHLSANHYFTDMMCALLFRTGLSLTALLMFNALRGMRSKLSQFLQDVTSESAPGSIGAPGVWKEIAKAE